MAQVCVIALHARDLNRYRFSDRFTIYKLRIIDLRHRRAARRLPRAAARSAVDSVFENSAEFFWQPLRDAWLAPMHRRP